jgi:hypothetical protein
MLIFELATGFWLLIKGTEPRKHESQSTRQGADLDLGSARRDECAGRA